MNDHPLDAGTLRLRVLLVDDDPWMLRIMKASLPGAAVVTCTSGEEALRVLRSDVFDVVCSDLVMPGVRGEVVLHAAAEAREETGLLLVTGLSDAAGLDDEGFEVLRKPFDPERFATLIGELGERARTRGAGEGGASRAPDPTRGHPHGRPSMRAPQGSAR